MLKFRLHFLVSGTVVDWSIPGWVVRILDLPTDWKLSKTLIGNNVRSKEVTVTNWLKSAMNTIFESSIFICEWSLAK